MNIDYEYKLEEYVRSSFHSCQLDSGADSYQNHVVWHQASCERGGSNEIWIFTIRIDEFAFYYHPWRSEYRGAQPRRFFSSNGSDKKKCRIKAATY